MPATTTDEPIVDEELDGNEADGSEESDEGTADGNPDAETEGLDDKTKKRLSDLQSKADKAEARASKAEKALQAAGTSGKGPEAGSNDPARDALMQELREASLDAMYGEFPELKQYNIDRSLIEGSTRAQMRESATSVVALVKNVATKVKNETLAQHGIKAEPSGSARKPPVNYGDMSDEDFEKLLSSM